MQVKKASEDHGNHKDDCSIVASFSLKVIPMYRRRVWVPLLLFVFAIVVIVGQYSLRGYRISFYGFPHASVPVNESSLEQNGLRITIKSQSVRDDTLHLHYALEWVKEEPGEGRFLFMRPFLRGWVLFWDSQGKQMKSEPEFSDFLGTFAFEEWPYLFESDLTVSVPNGAKHVAIAVTNEIATKKITLRAP